MVDGNQDRWLSLGEASTMLNVHPSTLRRWADGGLVPCQRTPGGHRRFSRQALLPLLDGSTRMPMREDDVAPATATWAEMWGDDGQPESLREPWQRLGGVVLQYLVRGDEDARLEQDAREIGGEIARRTLEAGGTPLHVTGDYLVFRSRMLPVAWGAPSPEGGGALGEVARFDRVLGEALLGVVGDLVEA